ncbi:MAG: type 1 glutamine amidotransferase domain-containing protein [Marinilabiliales bacterium]|mgnify:CR=1 FL=1|nr:MAG: type 1 glutamine amidotransferase domain-containing protein [Marinilabiliales bacterium]
MRLSYLLVLILSLSLLSACSQHSNKDNQNKTNQKKVLFVLTSHNELGETGEKTGFWLEEFATPYYKLLDKGVKITIVSPKGGKAPIDPRSKSENSQTEATKRFFNDEAVQNIIKNTMKLEDVKAEDYDAVFYPGGHGPLWDLAESKTSKTLIEAFNKQGKPMAFVCHGPAVLKNVENTKGEPLVKGKKVTGFTNTEEEAAQLSNVVPFKVEDMLKKNGGIYSKAANWNVNVVKDGNLITGQNPASSSRVAELLYESIK